MRTKLKITRGCLVNGRPCAEGAIVELDARTANDLVNEGCGELFDPREAATLRDAVRRLYERDLEDARRAPTVVGRLAGAPEGPWRPLH